MDGCFHECVWSFKSKHGSLGDSARQVVDCTFTAGGAGSTPGQGTKVPHATRQSEKSGGVGGVLQSFSSPMSHFICIPKTASQRTPRAQSLV